MALTNPLWDVSQILLRGDVVEAKLNAYLTKTMTCQAGGKVNVLHFSQKLDKIHRPGAMDSPMDLGVKSESGI